MKSSKHAKGKERMSKKEDREKELAESFQKYNDDVHLRKETLPHAQQVFRMKVLKVFLRAGITLNKLAVFVNYWRRVATVSVTEGLCAI